MQQTNPKVTVCMPNYNYGHFIGQSIQSVLDQDFNDFELIIVDDCSTDNSDEVIRSFSDNRIKYHHNKTNIGRLKNINKCLQLSQGEYITILPSDGLYTPSSLIKRKEILDSNPSIGFVFSAGTIIDEAGKFIRDAVPFADNWVREGEDVFRTLVLGNHILTLTCMVRKKCFDHLGLLNEEIKATGSRDWELWLRISLFYDIAYINHVTSLERMHDKNSNHYFRCSPAGCRNRFIVLEHTFAHLPPERRFLYNLKQKAMETLANRTLITAFGNLIRGQSDFAKGNVKLAIMINNRLSYDLRTFLFYFLAFFGKWTKVMERIPKFIRRAIRAIMFK